MSEINKNLLKFTGIALFLVGGLLLVLSKFLPLFFLHSVYLCQQFVNSISFRIPSFLGYFLLGLVIFVILGGLYKAFSVFFKIRQLKKSLIIYKQSNHSLHKLLRRIGLEKIVMIIDSEKPFAFCIGIHEQRIYISTALTEIMNINELEAILLHEKYHLLKKDSLVLFIASILRTLFPFFPIVSDLLAHYKITREIEADNYAVSKLGNSLTVISVLRKFLSFPSPSFTNSTAIADYPTLEPRIIALMQRDRKIQQFKIVNVIISIVSFTLLAFLIITPVHAVTMQMPNDTTMLCLQDDACAKWCKEHNTVIPYSKNSSSSVNASYVPAVSK